MRLIGLALTFALSFSTALLPAPTVRLGQGKPLQLAATDRLYLIAVPKDFSGGGRP